MKKFNEFIKESFSYDDTYFKIMPVEDFQKVLIDGYLSPVGTVQAKGKEYKGNWTIPCSNLNEWLVPIKYFGSPIQALIMKYVAKPRVVLHLKIDENNTIHNRDITKMFIDPDIADYYGSFTDKRDYKINESFIGGKISNFEVINSFTPPEEVSKYMADPKSVLDFIYGRGEIKFTDEKMVSIQKALMDVMMKKMMRK